MKIGAQNYYYSAQNINKRETVFAGSGYDPNDLRAVIENRLSKIESPSFKITDEQKNYLREKYDLKEMTFPINGTSSAVTESFMKDLYEMGIITKKELSKYDAPTRPMRKPANYDSLPDDVKKSIVEDPLFTEGKRETPTTYILGAHIDGENIRDAFEILAVQQKRYSEIALGENERNKYLESANMYNKLLNILDEIYK